jgi:dipeptidyl aminopeptidase/acylaminoacyl peptidase
LKTFSITAFTAVCWIVAPVFAKHTVTLDDAYAVKAVGVMDAHPATKLLAFEAEGGIVVLSLADEGRRIKHLQGSQPSWSPDGKRLAFYSSVSERQLHVWNRRSDRIEQVTQIAGGISPNIAFGVMCPPSISWAPDSKSVVLATRLLGSPQDMPKSRERDGVRVYDANYPLDHVLIEGIFKKESFWDAFMPETPDLGERMKAIDREPQLGNNRLIIVDTERKNWTVLSAADRKYGCPSWSPDGRHIAAVADVSTHYPITYFGHLHVQATKLALFDLSSKREQQVETPTTRIAKPVWSRNGEHLAMVAETRPELSTFTRILQYSVSRGASSFIPAPKDHAVKEVEWSVDGKTLLIKLADRFADSLWKIDPRTGKHRQIQTFGWQIIWQNDEFAEIDDGDVVLNVESAHFKGRLMLTGEKYKTPSMIYDANPQVAELHLGEQRRVTWRNKAGEEVDGVIVLPPGYEPGHRYPVIVNPYPRAPWDDFKLGPDYEDTGQLHAAWGYVVFRTGLRAPHATYVWNMTQTEAYAEKGRGAPGIPVMVDDFVSGIDHLVKEGIADPERIGLFGHSNGGWATNMLIVESSIPKAAMIASGVSNAILLSSFPLPMITRGRDPATNGNVFDNLDDYLKLSPIYRMRDINIPILLTLGDQDWLWVPQMIAQYGVLRSEGMDVQLVRYANEGHSLRNRASIEDALERMHTFFDRHLKGTEAR